ncbi:putative long-chain-alcohol O-fatty-acyltransferase 1 [Morella rubra]|uniref:Putative long-chain-alcohol O-fatty-acyltransferase 1 n=1 Tax=Morella rubra TaxID=262757 RepID=A0A6A1WWE0_9ROSI|nr:putative long-chain-alcohol O-fatty-acyltransferase 1 [Morella rubra]
MECEIDYFFKVWIIALTSLCYCYYIAARIRRGMMRLLSLLPIFYLFITLPLSLESFHIVAPTTFFLVWLGNFKLILFVFDHGPLSPLPPKLVQFISIACLPLKIKQDLPQSVNNPLNTEYNKNPSPDSETRPNPTASSVTRVPESILLVIKAVILAMVIRDYHHRPLDILSHPYFIVALFCCHIFPGVEIVLALIVASARAILGLELELEPQFNEPYLATSLQDFWGRRWNLVVSSILRSTVYIPVRHIFTNIVGPRWASLPAVVATFVVSGLMHEVIFYYHTRLPPTWEVAWFFVLHGMCVAIEIVVKTRFTGRWQLQRAVSGPLTLGFVAATGVWLFFPPMLRNGLDAKVGNQYPVLVNFVKVHLSFQKL